MAPQSGTADYPVVETSYLQERLEREGFDFEFFQAVRLLERLLPERSPVGGFVNPADEVVRFGANPIISFPASVIHQVEFTQPATAAPSEPSAEDDDSIFDAGPPPQVSAQDVPQARMTVNFMGLTGPNGALPLYYSELVNDRLRVRDTTLRAFFDLFNHRIISLFYLAWEKYRFAIAYERGDRDKFSHHLLDLIGLGTPHLQERQRVLDDSLLYYTGLLSLRVRSASALRNLLMDYFDVPVEIEQFVGTWRKLDDESQCCFDHDQTVSEQVGVGAVVGDEVWDQQSGARIKLGPLTLRRYLDFLPNGPGWKPLQALTRFFSGGQIDFEVQLILQRGEVPPCELGAEGDEEPQLGWVSWGKTKSMTRDPGDTILKL